MFARIEDPSCPLPQSAREVFRVMIESVRALNERIHLLDREIARRAREDETARRLMTIPGAGQITGTALLALASPLELPQGPRLCSMAGNNAAAALHWRQAEAGIDHEDGRTNAKTAADHRQKRPRSSCQQARRSAGLLARADDGPQAAQAGHRRARQ